MTAQAKNFENGARNAESTVVELNRIVAQAEELLKTLGEEGGAAVEAVRQRVQITLDAEPSNHGTVVVFGLGVVGLLFVGLSGSLAALSNMLFPSESLSEGIAKDLSAASNIILRLRVSHPILSVLTSVYLIFLAGWLKAKSAGSANVAYWSNVVSLLVIGQVVFGAATLLTLGPIVMQLGHLVLADAVWIAFVLLIASFLDREAMA